MTSSRPLAPGDAVLACSFRVSIDGHDIGTWLTCELGGVQLNPTSVKDGGNRGFEEQLAGTLQWKPIVLTRPVNEDTVKVQQWIERMASRDEVCTGVVEMRGVDGSVVMSMTFRRARPVDWALPSMDVSKLMAATETLKIAHDGFVSDGSPAASAGSGRQSVGAANGRPVERARLTIRSVDGKTDTLECRFNPRQLVVSKSATWRTHRSPTTTGSGDLEWAGTEPRVIDLELTLDGTGAQAAKDLVLTEAELLLGCCEPPKGATGKTAAPDVRFSWGQRLHIDAVVTAVTVAYTEFWPSGLPYRAEVAITLRERVKRQSRQNPTSGGEPDRRVRRVVEGDTLASIAYAEYRNPAAWRVIAEANHIDDPLRLDAGQLLELPAERDVVRALSSRAAASPGGHRAG